VGKITFVTGTDTGVGKTLLAACLLHHLRRKGINALGMKPFCSGSRSDARLLRSAGGNSLTLDEVNPFYFEQPLAPYAASKKTISLKNVVALIYKLAERCDHLIIEGAGGLLVPLGKGFFVADLIAALDCDVILVARNQLGTINHTLLSIQALASRPVTIALMSQKPPDLSSQSNAAIIREILPTTRVLELPYLGSRAKAQLPQIANRLRRTLDRIQLPIPRSALSTPVSPSSELMAFHRPQSS
jgi:dethiobiotin synthetase